MKTISARPETVQHDWYVIDATDKVLGRLATEVARHLRGKHKPIIRHTSILATILLSSTPIKSALPVIKKTTRCITTTPVFQVE
jgi:hypothetical protein